MCFIMSEKVNHDITQASQILFLDISMRRFTVHVDLRLPSSRAQSESGRFFISFFSGPKASEKRRTLRKSSVPDTLLRVTACRKSIFKKTEGKYFKGNNLKVRTKLTATHEDFGQKSF